MFDCLLDGLILGFCYSNLTRKSGRFELKLTIALVLQANRTSKYASNYPFTLHVSSFNCNKVSKKKPQSSQNKLANPENTTIL